MKQGNSRKQISQRGVFEKTLGSGDWWIRYADTSGRIRREKAGTKSMAIDLYRKRKVEVLAGKKLPEKLRARSVKFSEIADDAAEYVKSHNLGELIDRQRIARLKGALGNQPAEVPIEQLRSFFSQQDWSAGTRNRYRTVLSSIYRLAIENKKAASNPARLLKRLKESDGRVRFLNQHDADEEHRIRQVITAEFPEHMPELDVALNTGMRRGEQYVRIDWGCVNFQRRDLFVPQSKNGRSRHIPLNNAALAAFRKLRNGADATGPIFISQRGGKPLLGPRHWFEDAVREAKLKDFTWHDLRHTFASRLVMGGVHLRTVAELLGHAQIQMTMRYAHLAPAHKLAAVQKLDTFDVKGGRSGILNPRRDRRGIENEK